jgi:hypothetical protein
MAYRESLVQTRFRLRKDLLHKLEREAKRGDRAVNDEVARRLEASFGDEEEIQRLRKECERLILLCHKFHLWLLRMRRTQCGHR